MESYSMAYDELMAILMVLGSFGFSLTVIIATFAVFAFGFLALFIASRIPYCKLAKKVGIPNRWLLWIPIGEMYIRLQLSKREYSLFGFIKLKERKNIFWFYLIFNLIMIFIGGGLSVILILSSILPLIGMFIIFAIQLLWLIYYTVNSIIGWRVNYDILMTYGMQKHAMWASVVNCFVPCLMIVFSYIIMDKEPDYSV